MSFLSLFQLNSSPEKNVNKNSLLWAASAKKDMAQEESLKLHRFRHQKRKRLFPDSCSAACLQALKSLGTAGLASLEYLTSVYSLRKCLLIWEGNNPHKSILLLLNISEVLSEACAFFSFLLVVKHHISQEDKETNMQESILIQTPNILCVCPAVISCAALTWMDPGPVSVWFKGNTAGSQAVLDLVESGCPQLVSVPLLQGSRVL